MAQETQGNGNGRQELPLQKGVVRFFRVTRAVQRSFGVIHGRHSGCEWLCDDQSTDVFFSLRPMLFAVVRGALSTVEEGTHVVFRALPPRDENSRPIAVYIREADAR